MKKVLIILGTFLILIIITGVYIYYNVKPDIKLNGGDIIISYGDINIQNLELMLLYLITIYQMT